MMILVVCGEAWLGGSLKALWVILTQPRWRAVRIEISQTKQNTCSTPGSLVTVTSQERLKIKHNSTNSVYLAIPFSLFLTHIEFLVYLLKISC